MNKTVKELTIDRGEWLQGSLTDRIGSNLFDSPTGLKCCLGFYGKACGVPIGSMRDLPFFTESIVKPEMKWLLEHTDPHTSPQNHLTLINDEGGRNLTQRGRERRIKTLFMKYGGIKVRFVGRVSKAWKRVGGDD